MGGRTKDRSRYCSFFLFPLSFFNKDIIIRQKLIYQLENRNYTYVYCTSDMINLFRVQVEKCEQVPKQN